MAHWREKMGQATFRGVPFHVETAELSGGRRTVDHEYPLRDVPFSEDMGRKAREFPVEGHVIGADYLQQKESLISALEEKGPGELVHSYYGTRRVSVPSFRVRESATEGGMATFSITFRETEEAPQFPNSKTSAARIDATGAAVVAALRERALLGDVALPSAYRASIESVVSGAAAAIDQALAPLLTVASELAAVKQLTADMQLDAAALAGAPADALDSVLEVFDAAPTLPARTGITALLQARGFSPTVERPPSTTTTRAAEQATYDLLTAIVRIASVVQAAKLASVVEWDSYEEAVSVRDQIAEALDADSETADDALFAELTQLRADLVRSVPGEDSDLPRLVQYTPPATVPSLVLAHRLYGALDRETDIVLRNGVKRPGFIVGGSALEVLSDA